MTRYTCILFFLFSICTLSAQREPYTAPLRDSSFTIDSAYYIYATKGYYSAVDEITALHDYLLGIDSILFGNEIEKMRQFAFRYNNKEMLQDIKLLKTNRMPNRPIQKDNKFYINEKAFKAKEAMYKELVKEASEDGNIILEINALYGLWMVYYYDITQTHYAEAFQTVKLLIKSLESTTDELFPMRCLYYSYIAGFYYSFRDYDNTFTYALKALKETPYYYDRGAFSARNTLGVYYRERQNLDSSDYYFHAILEDKKNIKDRNLYDAIALNNIGYNYYLRENYDTAISLFKQAIPLIYKQDKPFTSGIYSNLGNCYLRLNNIPKAKEAIDSALLYLNSQLHKPSGYYMKLFSLKSKYYACVGDFNRFQLYLDSAFLMQKKHEEEFNSTILLKVEQELFESEKKAGALELNHKNRLLLFSGIVIVVFFILLLFIINLYRRKQSAYKALVQKNLQWAEQPKLFIDSYETKTPSRTENEINQQDLEIMRIIDKEILEKRLFQNPDISLDALASELSINKYNLSKIINQTTGKNFNTFINEYRIKEAIKLLSDQKHDHLSIDGIAEECGFANRVSFYRSFKKETGISPSNFKNASS